MIIISFLILFLAIVKDFIFPIGFFFVYLGFLSGTFTIHWSSGEKADYLFNSSLPIRPASRALRY